jgi:FtsH-binding integral membrane protein
MANLSDEERFKLEYKKLDDDIRHYSTTRSALTSFLMTVGLTLLANSFNSSYLHQPSFLWITGLVVLCAAVYVCLEFSRRTERSMIHQKGLWDWSTTMTPPYPTRSGILTKAGRGAVLSEMTKDLMNVGIILVVLTIVAIFFWCKCGAPSAPVTLF